MISRSRRVKGSLFCFILPPSANFLADAGNLALADGKSMWRSGRLRIVYSEAQGPRPKEKRRRGDAGTRRRRDVRDAETRRGGDVRESPTKGLASNSFPRLSPCPLLTASPRVTPSPRLPLGLGPWAPKKI